MKSIELFSGAGGLALGFSKVGFHHELLVERNVHACGTMLLNKENGYEYSKDWNLFQGDIRDYDFSSSKNKVQLVAGGPPCQPFSLGGKHRGYDDTRDMFPQAVRSVREIRPKAFVFENVRGLLRESFSEYFEYIILQLTYPDLFKKKNEEWQTHLSRLEKYHTRGNYDGIHYRVVFRLVDAANFGVPQHRHRVFIVGFRNDINKQWSFPAESHSEEALFFSKWVSGEYWDEHKIAKRKTPAKTFEMKKRADQLNTDLFHSGPRHKRWLTVRDAIKDLPDPKSNHNVPNHEYRSGGRAYAGHTGSLLDEPSKALKAGDHGVPGGENMVVLDNGEVRYFTARESARIQTFPDEYLFHGSWTECMRQIGNAVPVRLAETVAENIYKHIA